jgi:hypothetical protein
MILNYSIVPNDTRQLVKLCLEEIWKEPEAQKICEVVYTDNPKVDQSAIQTAFMELHPDHMLVAVLLDIYHGRARVIKEMVRSHPDYRAAKQDLSTIFALLQKPGHFSSPGELSRELDLWCNKYSTVYASSALNFDDQIAFLGIKAKRYKYIYIFILTNFSNQTKKASFKHDLKPLITDRIVHQINLLQNDIQSLWNISNFIHLGPQGTSFNEGAHSSLNAMRPSKTSKITIETLEMMVGIACFNFNRKYTFTFVFLLL